MADGTLGWEGLKLANGRYLVLDKLGEGGMGDVYRAADTNLGCDVVVKTPRAAVLRSSKLAERLRREGRSLVALTHPHVVKILEVGEHDCRPFVVLQYLSGGCLGSRLAGLEEDPGGHARGLLQWLPDVADALDFVHERGYLHRDVKPGNILFDAHGNAYLSDFGIAHASQDSCESSGPNRPKIRGTPGYLAPEVLRGRPFDRRADQYALGITAYEFLAGARPFNSGPDRASLAEQAAREAEPLIRRSPGVPQALSDAVARALALDPDARFATCAEFAHAVESAVGRRGVFLAKPHLLGPTPDLDRFATPTPPSQRSTVSLIGAPGSEDVFPKPVPTSAAPSTPAVESTEVDSGRPAVRSRTPILLGALGVCLAVSALGVVWKGPGGLRRSVGVGRRVAGTSPIKSGETRPEGSTGEGPKAPSPLPGPVEITAAGPEADVAAEADVVRPVAKPTRVRREPVRTPERKPFESTGLVEDIPLERVLADPSGYAGKTVVPSGLFTFAPTAVTRADGTVDAVVRPVRLAPDRSNFARAVPSDVGSGVRVDGALAANLRAQTVFRIVPRAVAATAAVETNRAAVLTFQIRDVSETGPPEWVPVLSAAEILVGIDAERVADGRLSGSFQTIRLTPEDRGTPLPSVRRDWQRRVGTPYLNRLKALVKQSKRRPPGASSGGADGFRFEPVPRF